MYWGGVQEPRWVYGGLMTRWSSRLALSLTGFSSQQGLFFNLLSGLTNPVHPVGYSITHYLKFSYGLCGALQVSHP